MSNISLANKYRPAVFSEVVAQSNVKKILMNQLETGSIKQAYLFTGGAGTGKTTTARIFATEINGGKSGVIEIDGASNNGVDHIRNIIENCKFKSLEGDYKIFVIDECHMLTIGAWNAFLKVLEEPPKNTIFIMATTDPQKIPATILSRVQRFDFKRISLKEVSERLIYIAQQEGISISQDGADYLAMLSNGGMRDAITLLDTCSGYTKILSVDTIMGIMGATGYGYYLGLTNAILNNDDNEVITLIEEVHGEGKDLKLFMKNYQNYLLDLVKHKTGVDSKYISVPTARIDVLTNVVPTDVANIKVLLGEILKLNNDIKWEGDAKPIIEGSLIVLCL